jgi:hypothetical protein
MRRLRLHGQRRQRGKQRQRQRGQRNVSLRFSFRPCGVDDGEIWPFIYIPYKKIFLKICLK